MEPSRYGRALMTESQLFAPPSVANDPDSMANRAMGTRRRGRYKMPVLPDEAGPKAGGDWVSGGVQSVTNLLDGFEDQRGLQMWEQEGFAYGLAKQPSLFEEIALLAAEADRAGVDFSRLGQSDDPEIAEHGKRIRLAITGGNDRDAAEVSIVGRAKQAAGFNEARQAGTNRHQAWEHFCKTGELIGTPAMREQISAMYALLQDAGLEIVPELAERVIRNTAIGVAGRFDNALRTVRELAIELNPGQMYRVSANTLIMGDLKTKRRPHRSFASVEGQLACYARADYMLDWCVDGQIRHDPHYVPGPLHHVDQKLGVVLIMPSDGAPPYLKPADLEYGWEVAQHARRTLELRSKGSSKAHLGRTWDPQLTTE